MSFIFLLYNMEFSLCFIVLRTQGRKTLSDLPKLYREVEGSMCLKTRVACFKAGSPFL